MKNCKKQLEYKWVIAILGFLMIFLALGFMSVPRSLFIVPITEALGISRTAYSLNDTARYVSGAITNLFFGVLVARFGAKKLAITGFLTLCASALCYALAGNVFVLCLGGFLLGVGGAWTSTSIISYVINHWFSEHKGTIMGGVLAASGVGGAAATQILSPIIESGPYGYRNAYWVTIAILLAFSVVLLIFFKDKPDTPITPSATAKKQRSQDWSGISFSAAMKKWYFYGIIAVVFLSGMILQGTYGIAGAHLKDVGLKPELAAIVLSVNSVFLSVFKFLTGVVYDKFGLRTTVTTCMSSSVIASILLVLVNPTPLGVACAFGYSILSALALPLETIALPLYAGDLFGHKSVDHLVGIFAAVLYGGFAVSSVILNAISDIFGSYNVGIIGCSIGIALVLILTQVVISAAYREKKHILEAEDTM